MPTEIVSSVSFAKASIRSIALTLASSQLPCARAFIICIRHAHHSHSPGDARHSHSACTLSMHTSAFTLVLTRRVERVRGSTVVRAHSHSAVNVNVVRAHSHSARTHPHSQASHRILIHRHRIASTFTGVASHPHSQASHRIHIHSPPGRAGPRGSLSIRARSASGTFGYLLSSTCVYVCSYVCMHGLSMHVCMWYIRIPSLQYCSEL